VVVGQKLMQAASDMFLGWYTRASEPGMEFYVRQLSDAKIKPVIEVMKSTNLKAYAQLCGQALARAHIRSGDAAVLSGYMGQSSAFEDALADFSVAYAEQNERDHAALVAAVRDGRIEAQVEA
jgi:predicted 3-demethylubiquinone-9 3-methyltransferase (glyoxalase superfamily)